jgi:hypothetical protein
MIDRWRLFCVAEKLQRPATAAGRRMSCIAQNIGSRLPWPSVVCHTCDGTKSRLAACHQSAQPPLPVFSQHPISCLRFVLSGNFVNFAFDFRSDLIQDDKFSRRGFNVPLILCFGGFALLDFQCSNPEQSISFHRSPLVLWLPRLVRQAQSGINREHLPANYSVHLVSSGLSCASRCRVNSRAEGLWCMKG